MRNRFVSCCLLILAGCSSNNSGGVTPTSTDGGAPPENTYVGNFDVGDLSFTQVWVPDVGQSGYDLKIWFDLTTKKAKQKVFINIDLIPLDSGNASDLNTADPNFSADNQKITVGAFIVDQITPDAPVHAEQTFTLPPNLADGKYAAIFGINQIDVYPEINAAQGEPTGENPRRILVAPATVIIGKPTKPNLRVLTSSLTANYFTQPVVDTTPGALPPKHIQANLEVDSMAVDTTQDVDVTFKLRIGENEYPLQIGVPTTSTDPSQPSALSLLDRWTYKAGDVHVPALPDDIDPSDAPLHSTGPIAIATQMPIGRTFDLYLPDAAWANLKDGDLGEVVMTIDPDNKIDEWGSTVAEQKGDNVKRLPVQYLVAPPASDSGFKAACHSFYSGSQQYSTIVKDLLKDESYGNDNFKVSYGVRGVMSGADTSVKFGTYNAVAGKVFGFGFRVLDANAEVDSDATCGSYYGYEVDVFGIKVFSGGSQFDAGEAKTLWSGDYKVSKEFETTKTILVGGIVPIDVNAGVTGILGVEPELSVGPLLKLQATIAPYAELRGKAEGGLNLLLIRGGVGIDLQVIKLAPKNMIWAELPFKTAKYPNNSPYTALTLNYRLALQLNTLDGRFYLWGDYLSWFKWKRIGEFDLVRWNGLSWNFDLVPPVTKTFALVQK